MYTAPSAGGTLTEKFRITSDGKAQVGTGVTIEGNGQATYTGIVTATSFVGDGSSLTGTDATSFTVSANNSTNETVYPVFVDGATGSQGAETDTGLTYNPSTGNLTSTKFTGDGSGLTGISASGSGVVIKHDGSTVGTAGTINFSTNLDVSAISAGIVTVTASGGTSLTSDAQGNTVGGTNSGDSFSGTSAINNTLFGYNSGTAITSGDKNTSIGYDALKTMTTTERNTAVGFEALKVATGDLSCAFGSQALRADNGNGYNAAFGASSG